MKGSQMIPYLFKQRPAFLIFILLIIFLPAISSADAELETIDITKLIGYVILDYTRVEADIDGADGVNRKVLLENGMVFEFKRHPHSYFYNLSVVVVAQPTIINRNYIYKLFIEDKIYDVVRLK